ncbi:uncharacterized protein LOC135805550 [Sycon ciliatum]|uniref:uncharacterized protein LOC135805550 n=1 Tax=Sycon ciliatum TaxID=27933 RepID=UPI0031F673EB
MAMEQPTLALSTFVRNINVNLGDIYFGTSLASVLFVLPVIISYVTMPKMRRHPAELLFNRTMLDLVICLSHIITYIFIVSRSGPNLSTPDQVKSKCRALSFIYQIALFGSNSWYFVLSVDLFLAVRNPFSSNADYMPYYYLVVYVTSIITGIVLVTGNYGVTVFNYCWSSDHILSLGANRSTVDAAGDLKNTSDWAWGIYYGPHLVLCVVSLGVVIFATIALNRGLPASGETRRRVVRFGFFYVVAFAIEWALRLILYLVQDSYLIPNALKEPYANNYQNKLHGVAITFAIIEGLRGFFDFLLWFGTGSLSMQELRFRSRRVWAKWTGDDLEESGRSSLNETLLDKTQALEVSSVLRHDMIICTSWGIVDSAPVNIRPPNLSVTGFEDSLRAQTHMQINNVEDREPSVSGDGDVGSQLNNFHTQRQELQLWLKTTGGVRSRRIHCPTALQSTSFDFRDYSPEVFSCVRSLRGVDPITYCKSFNISKSKGNSAMMEKFTEGRSGSFFYFTHDNRYIVKTVTDSETALLDQHVRDYFFHLHSNPDSLLTRFFGLHAMRLSPEQKYISLMVMENIFPSTDFLKPNERYDLKGSWVARRTLKGKKRNMPLSKLTLKDGDLDRKIRVGPEAKQRLMAQLRKDVGFLASIGIMDYSLLIGIRDFENDPREELPSMEMRERSLGASRQDSRTARRDPAQSLGYVPPSPIGGISVNSSLPPLAGGLGQPPPHMTPPIDQSDADLPMPWHRSFYGGLLGLPPVQPPSGPQAGDDNLSVTESALHEIGSGRRSGAATVATGGDGSGQGSQAASGDAVKREEKVWSVYYMGLIDILQSYNFSKKAEHFFKSNIRCMDSHGISAVNVNEYAERFIHAMDTILV